MPTYYNCKHCGSSKKSRPSNSRNIYCSVQCQQDHSWFTALLRIRKTKKFRTEREAKRYLRETTAHQCALCKRRKWCGKPLPLILDHVDGKHDNWSVKNFRRICPNCDAQTPTYKGRNAGNGRQWRRARYAEGKTY